MALASQRLSNIKATHTAKLLLLLKEKELVGLHIELSANPSVVVNHDIIYAEGIQLLATCQASRTRTNDGHLCLIHLHLTRLLWAHIRYLAHTRFDVAHLLHAVHQRHTDAAHLAVDQHLARTALADAAVQTAVAPVEAVAVHRETSLMQGGCNRVTLASLHLLTIVNKLHHLALRDV